MAEVKRPGGRPGVVVAIGGEARAGAEAAAAQFTEIWRARRDLSDKTPLEQTGADPVAGVGQAGVGCEALVSPAAPNEAERKVPVFRHLMSAPVRCDFPPLAVGWR